MFHVIDRPLPVTIAGAISTTWTRVARHAIESRGSNSGEFASLGDSGSGVGDVPFERTQREAVERRVAELVVVESAEGNLEGPAATASPAAASRAIASRKIAQAGGAKIS